MEVTIMTWVIAAGGLVLMLLLGSFQLIAVLRPRSAWTIDNVYGGSPEATDPTAYFAFNHGFAIADVYLWMPIQVAGSIGMLAGQRWGFLLALIGSVPFWYTAVLFFVWDRDLGFRQPTLNYWVLTWAIWPLFGVIEAGYCFGRLV